MPRAKQGEYHPKRGSLAGAHHILSRICREQWWGDRAIRRPRVSGIRNEPEILDYVREILRIREIAEREGVGLYMKFERELLSLSEGRLPSAIVQRGSWDYRNSPNVYVAEAMYADEFADLPSIILRRYHENTGHGPAAFAEKLSPEYKAWWDKFCQEEQAERGSVMPTPTLAVSDPHPSTTSTGAATVLPLEILHPHPSLRFALNECNGSYWCPGQNGHWEIAPTPFGALAVHAAFDVTPLPPRLAALSAFGSALTSNAFDPSPVSQDDLLSRGALTLPWAHQTRTLDWLLERTAVPGSGALLYLGLGTGKTRIVLDWLRLRDIRRALIVAPRAVLPAWEKEARFHYGDTFDVWTSAMSRQAPTGHKVDDARKFLKDATRPALIVVNYDIVWRKEFSRFVESAGIETVIADECHKLKGRSSRRSLYFRTAWKRHPYRIALTGTPLSNGVLTDAFGQYAFLDPGIYGLSIQRFEDRYVVRHRQHKWLVLGYRNEPDFHRRFWWIARHEDRSVLTLPPITEQTRMVSLPIEARRAYADMRDEMIAQIKNGIITASNAAVAVGKLQQMANGTVITAEGTSLVLHTEKRQALEEILEETGTAPIVVFAFFKNDLLAIHEAAKSAHLQSLELSGRRDELARWQGGEATVLAVQVQSGAEGISLVRAQYGVFFSPSHALAQMDQAKARLHRPGQEHPVTLIHLLADKTVDTQITNALANKQNFVQSLLDSRGEVLDKDIPF